MFHYQMMRRSVLFLAAASVLLSSACGSSANSIGAMMPGGTNGVAAGSTPTGAGMMGGAGMGGPAYHLHQLSCAASPAVFGARVTVTLGDMDMTQMMNGTAPMGAHMMLRATPTSVAAGKISFVVSNMGWRTHEMVILPMTAAAVAGRRALGGEGKVNETGSLGEVSNSCAAGAGEGITAGSIGWATVTLPAGRYELVCNVKNHYADGMYQEIDVT